MAKLLYVDDEETIGKVVSRFFARRGDAVTLARSVTEAQEILTLEDPDVVFIDVWLGQESGFELMGWIDDTRPHLSGRVTFVTGELVDEGHAERLWKTLGRPVIQKPFELSSLAQTVDHAGTRAGA